MGGASYQLCEEARRLFEVFRANHNGQAVRTTVQGILKTLSPTPVRPSGGVYFVPSVHDEDLAKLVAFTSAFAKGEGFKIPVVKTAESVMMIEQKVADHLDSILSQCRQATADASLSKGKLADIINETKGVISGYRDYESIIKEQKEGMEARIQIIRDAVSILLEKAGG